MKKTLSETRIKICAAFVALAMATGIVLCGLSLVRSARETGIVSGAFFYKDSPTYSGNKSNAFYTKIDLNDKTVSPTLLKKGKTTKKVHLSSMMTSAKNIIGINGSFFNTVNGVANAVGITVYNGYIRSMSPSLNSSSEKWATLCFSEDKTAEIKYLKPYIQAVSSTGKTYKINRYNYAYAGGTGLSVYDSNFSTKSYGNSYDDITELVVEDGIMTELRKNKEAVKIPNNGYVITASGSGAKKLKKLYEQNGQLLLNAYEYEPSPEPTPEPTVVPTSEATSGPTSEATSEPTSTPSPELNTNLTPALVSELNSDPTPRPDTEPTTGPTSGPTEVPTVGPTSEVSSEPSAEPSYPAYDPIPFKGVKFSTYKTCITGGAMLVKKNNALTSFSHVPVGTSKSSLHPRTAVGISKDGKSMIMLVVDGRSSSSAGMSMPQLAKYLKSLGAYNAINFDGGGSSTICVKIPGSTSADVKNKPSGGSERSIINGLGINCTLSSDGIPTGGQLSGQSTALTNTPLKLTLDMWDSSLHKCSYNNSDITWDIKGVDGEIENGIFTPTSSGKAVITATYKEFNFTKTITCGDLPVKYKFNVGNKLKSDPGKTYKIYLTATDKDGLSTKIYSKKIIWKLNGTVGTISNLGKLTLSNSGSATLSSEYNDIIYSLPISVSTKTEKALDTFSSLKRVSYNKKYFKISRKLTGKKKYCTAGKKSLQLKYTLKKPLKKLAYGKLTLPLTGTIPALTYNLKLNLYFPSTKNLGNTRFKLKYYNSKKKVITKYLSGVVKKGKTTLSVGVGLKKSGKLKSVEMYVKYKQKHSAQIYFDSFSVQYKHYM